MTADLDWIESIPFRDPQLAREWLQRLQLQERPDQETDLFRQRLRESLPHVNDPDAALANLGCIECGGDHLVAPPLAGSGFRTTTNAVAACARPSLNCRSDERRGVEAGFPVVDGCR